MCRSRVVVELGVAARSRSPDARKSSEAVPATVRVRKDPEWMSKVVARTGEPEGAAQVSESHTAA